MGSALDFLRELVAEEQQNKRVNKKSICPHCGSPIAISNNGRYAAICPNDHYLVFYDGEIKGVGVESWNHDLDGKSRNGVSMLLGAMEKILEIEAQNLNVRDMREKIRIQNEAESEMSQAMIYCDNNDIILHCKTVTFSHGEKVMDTYSDNNGVFIPVYLRWVPHGVDAAKFRFSDLKRYIGGCERITGVLFLLDANGRSAFLAPSDYFAECLYPGASGMFYV